MAATPGPSRRRDFFARIIITPTQALEELRGDVDCSVGRPQACKLGFPHYEGIRGSCSATNFHDTLCTVSDANA